MRRSSLAPLVFALAACGSNPGTGPDGGSGQTCTTRDGCAQGQICEQGMCVPATTCTTAADCPDGDTCGVTGVCLGPGACAAEGDCPTEDFCSAQGTCIPDGTCATNGDCAAGLKCDPTMLTCVPDGSCGATEVTIAPIPPNLLMVLDRSCSMTAKVGGVPKWTSAVDAIKTLTTSFADKARWGLTLFPDTTGVSCGQDAIPVPVAPGTEPAIQALLTSALTSADAYYPDGPCVTNIDAAMEQAATEPALADPARKSFVMLVTDGMQSGCNLAGGDAGTEQIIKDLAAKGVKTFVVGFGGEVDTAQMDKFAIAGETALPQSPRYYQADNAAELQAALGAIAVQLIGCDFVLTDPPAGNPDLYAFFNNTTSVPRDPGHTSGWDYDPATMTVTFYGGFCDQLQAGTVTDVDIVYGCAGPT
ncbi:MAG: VWA domain-containing protein [Deltaproteobacteria bacterium]|nr:VWA domain-containing protein [Deltaproteobacteria bacterium]